MLQSLALLPLACHASQATTLRIKAPISLAPFEEQLATLENLAVKSVDAVNLQDNSRESVTAQNIEHRRKRKKFL